MCWRLTPKGEALYQVDSPA